jgi:hypothetical protein
MPPGEVKSDRGNLPLKMADNWNFVAIPIACATGPLHQIGIER